MYFLQPCGLGISRQAIQIRLILVCFLLPSGFQNTIVDLTDYVSREQEYQNWPGLGQKKTFCKQHMLLPACTYFLSHDHTDKTSLEVSETLL